MRVAPNPKARLTTRAGWEAYCVREPLPEPPPIGERKGLSDAALAEYDTARLRYMAEPKFVMHPAVKTITSAVVTALTLNEHNTGASSGVIVDGPPASGKTELVKKIARNHHRQRLAAATPEEYDDLLPVVFVDAPTQKTVKALALNMCRAIGVPLGKNPSRRTLQELEDSIHRVLEGVGTSMFVIDEVQRLGTDSHGRDAARFLKQLANDYETVTMMFSGFDLLARGPFTDEDGEQLLGRCEFQPLAPLPNRSDDEAEEWTRLLTRFEKHLYLVKHRPGDLVRLADYLHDRTQGRVGALSKLLRGAAVTAVTSKTERITDKVLDQVKVDLSTDRAAQHQRRTKDKVAAAERKAAARNGRAA